MESYVPLTDILQPLANDPPQIQVTSNVLIPPKKLNGKEAQWTGEELTEEDLKERLGPFVEERPEELQGNLEL